MPITVRCPICNKPGQIQGTQVMSKRLAKGANGGLIEACTTIRYNLRCSDPSCSDPAGEPPRWKMIMEFAGWSYNPPIPIFEEPQVGLPKPQQATHNQ